LKKKLGKAGMIFLGLMAGNFNRKEHKEVLFFCVLGFSAVEIRGLHRRAFPL
jgi:hypothetical protein